MLPVFKLFGEQYQNVRFDVIHGENGLDIFTQAHFSYPKAMATVTCGLGVKSEGRLLIAGTKGYIVVEAPWWKTGYFEVHHENLDETEKYSTRFLGDGLRYEISEFLSRINGDTKGEFKLNRKESQVMARVMEKFLKEEKRL